MTLHVRLDEREFWDLLQSSSKTLPDAEDGELVWGTQVVVGERYLISEEAAKALEEMSDS